MTTTNIPALTTSLTSPADALREEEVARTRTFIRVGWIAAVGAGTMMYAVPGDRRIAEALLAMLGVTVLASVATYLQLRVPSRYDARQLNILAYAAIACTQLGILYAGAFSAAAIIIALGVYFFCRTERLGSAVVVYLLSAGMHALIGALVVANVIEDPGFAPIRADCPVPAQIAALLSLQQMYAMCFFLARGTRKSSLRAIDQLQKATRLAAQRDAQVFELRQDLDRALQIGGPGRFTGQVVGTWELGTVLGRGSMGEVYEARNAHTGAEGAVKLLRRELLGESAHVERFFREVRSAGTIDSRHVVRVLDASGPEDPLPFLVMERLCGKTLGELLRAGPLDRDQLAALVAQVSTVLDAAAAANIVHRDLKPHNLFLCDDGVWKVLDFGVALLGDTSGTLTQGGVIGTPAYMAPEQAKGEHVDSRADLYALGAVLYRSITGRVPFAAKDTPALLYSVVHVMPQRPTAIAGVSAHVEAFLAIALAKSRDARFQTAADFAAAFADAQRETLPPSMIARANDLVRRHAWTEPVSLRAPRTRPAER